MYFKSWFAANKSHRDIIWNNIKFKIHNNISVINNNIIVSITFNFIQFIPRMARIVYNVCAPNISEKYFIFTFGVKIEALWLKNLLLIVCFNTKLQQSWKIGRGRFDTISFGR